MSEASVTATEIPSNDGARLESLKDEVCAAVDGEKVHRDSALVSAGPDHGHRRHEGLVALIDDDPRRFGNRAARGALQEHDRPGHRGTARVADGERDRSSRCGLPGP